MGRVKQLMMEMEEHDYTGFSKGEKYVCTHHFDDKYLNQYIQENSEDGICSYCHKKGRVIDMSALADHIGMRISIFSMMLILKVYHWLVLITMTTKRKYLV